MKIKTDGYVLESNVHFPTDINLLWDSVRKSLDLIEKFEERWEITGWRKMREWRKKLKYAKMGLEQAKRGGGRNKEERVVKLVKEYLEIANSLEEKIFRSIKELEKKPLSGCDLLHIICLEDYHGMVMHHWLLVHDRLVEGRVIEHSEKYFSIFERHSEWINKGKAGHRVEIGHVVLISSDENRLILDYEVLNKKGEKEGLLESMDRLMKNYEERLASLSVDKGFYVGENKEFLEEFIGEVCMPKPGKKTQKQKEQESRPAFKKLRKEHIEIESVINSLEHHGLNRCYCKGIDGFERYVGYGVLAYNLHQVGKQKYKKEEAKRERLKRKREREGERGRRTRLKEAA